MRNRAVTPRLADWVEPRFIQLALKNMQITNVADLFDIMDEYGAGVLRPERLIKAVHDQGIGSPEAEYLVSSYPLNDRGVIERQDFINRAATMVDKPSGEPPSSGWGCLVLSIISCKPSPSPPLPNTCSTQCVLRQPDLHAQNDCRRPHSNR